MAQPILHWSHRSGCSAFPCRKYLLLRGQHAYFEPALHYWKRANNYWLFCAIPIEIRLPTFSVRAQESKYIRFDRA